MSATIDDLNHTLNVINSRLKYYGKGKLHFERGYGKFQLMTENNRDITPLLTKNEMYLVLNAMDKVFYLIDDRLD